MTLHADSVTVRLRGHTVLREVSACALPGRLTVVLGPNGAGKTTLLRVLSGEHVPQAGAVRMNGLPLAQWSREARARVRAVMPHQTATVFAFSAEEVVLLGRLPHTRTVPSRHDRALAVAALRAADALHLRDRPLPELSAGERQRVALARALAQIWEPQPALGARYLLLDEPTSNLDLAHQHALLRHVCALAREGVGVLAVMHDLNLAAQYADDLLLLCDGAVLSAGAPEQVLTAHTVGRAYCVPVTVMPHPRSGRPVVLVDEAPPRSA
jgi:iron complex transport system ATP-binding protein